MPHIRGNSMGASMYKVIEMLEFEPNECVVEIGSEHGEGSTAFLSEFCLGRNIPFFSVDVDPVVFVQIVRIPGVLPFNMTGEHFLEYTFSYFGQKIKFAYLDNFDWIWSSWPKDHPLILEETVIYNNIDMVLSNENSQKAHLTQAMLIDKFAADRCVIVLDDTWLKTDGTFDGKGGTAVPWLLANGYHLVHEPKAFDGDPDSANAFIAVQRTRVNDVSNYTEAYYHKAQDEYIYAKMGLLRPDQLAAVAYTLGISYFGDSVYKRIPGTIYSIGCGEGYLEEFFEKQGYEVIGVDPSPGAKALYRGSKLIDRYEGGGGTILFVESIEHIPEEEILRILSLVPPYARVFIGNWLDSMPIYPTSDGWDHITLIDDAFFDKISVGFNVFLRRGSFLVMDKIGPTNDLPYQKRTPVYATALVSRKGK